MTAPPQIRTEAMAADGDYDGAVAARVCEALADGSRRQVWRAIVATPGVTAMEIAATLPISRQAVGKHVAHLAVAGLVDARRCGRGIALTARTRPLAMTARWMVHACKAITDVGRGVAADLPEVPA